MIFPGIVSLEFPGATATWIMRPHIPTSPILLKYLALQSHELFHGSTGCRLAMTPFTIQLCISIILCFKCFAPDRWAITHSLFIYTLRPRYRPTYPVTKISFNILPLVCSQTVSNRTTKILKLPSTPSTCWENTGGIQKGAPPSSAPKNGASPFQCSPESDLDFQVEPNKLHIMVCLGRHWHLREL